MKKLVLILLLVVPNVTLAQTGLLPFAGIVSDTEVCTCSPGILWIWFTPLYLGGDVVVTGPEDYSVYSTTLYGYYMIGKTGLWHLGDYNPFPLACWIIAGPACLPLPAIGLMSKVGTNRDSDYQAP